MGNSPATPTQDYDAFVPDDELTSIEHDGLVNAIVTRAPQGGGVRKGQVVQLFIDASGIRIVPQHTRQFQAISFFHIKSWLLDPCGDSVTIKLTDGPSYSFCVPVPAEVFHALTAKTAQIFTEIRHREISQRNQTNSPLTPQQLEAAFSPRAITMSPILSVDTRSLSRSMSALSEPRSPERVSSVLSDDCPLTPMSPAQRIKQDRRRSKHSDLRRAALSMSPVQHESPPESPVLRRELVSTMRELNSSLAVLHRRKLDLMGAITHTPLAAAVGEAEATESPSKTAYSSMSNFTRDVMMVKPAEKERLETLDKQAAEMDVRIDHYMGKLKRIGEEQENPLLRFVQ